MKTKICTKCHEEKALEHFYYYKAGRGDVRSVCRRCCVLISVENDKKTPSKRRERNNRYYHRNKDKIQFKTKKKVRDVLYRVENREKLRERSLNNHYKRQRLKYFVEFIEMAELITQIIQGENHVKDGNN